MKTTKKTPLPQRIFVPEVRIEVATISEMEEILANHALPFTTRTNRTDPLDRMNLGARRFVTRDLEIGSLFDES